MVVLYIIYAICIIYIMYKATKLIDIRFFVFAITENMQIFYLDRDINTYITYIILFITLILMKYIYLSAY